MAWGVRAVTGQLQPASKPANSAHATGLTLSLVAMYVYNKTYCTWLKCSTKNLSLLCM